MLIYLPPKGFRVKQSVALDAIVVWEHALYTSGELS